MQGALTSLKVLDLTHVLAGPFCAYQLALLGAEVLKIESPHAPDCARGRGPDADLNAEGLGLNYQVQGGNKRALALDLSDPRGREVLLALVGNADILVENYVTGALDRLSLGYAALSAVNPALIHCSITGYGDTGPQAAIGAYDNVIQAASGTVAQCAGIKPDVSFVDYSAGYAAAFAVMCAVHQRHRTGAGCHISVSMLEVAMSLMAPEAAAVQYGAAPGRGRETGISSYDTADGTLMLGAFRPEQYVRLARLLAGLGHNVAGLDQVRDWPDVWSLPATTHETLQAVFLTGTADDWVTVLHDADLPAARVQTLAEAVASDQLAARGYFAANPDRPDIHLPLSPFAMSRGGPEITLAPPRHGEHGAQVLVELGYGGDTIRTLTTEGVIK